MSTEYRRGIPSIAHVEAATRLGLLWQTRSGTGYRRRDPAPTAQPTEQNRSYRPIRPDGTSVDWDVLDQEVARVGQRGQPQGFRADLWRRICAEFNHHDEAFSLKDINAIDVGGSLIINGYARTWPQPFGPAYDGILARWTVYQELKPLYDIVDGAQGEAAMPRDVEAEWDRQSLGSAYNGETDGVWVLRRPNVPGYSALEVYAPPDAAYHGRLYSQQGSAAYCTPLRNFAAVLDAVAERRVAERMQTQAQSTIPINPEHDALVASRLSQRARSGRTVTQPAQPEPRRFADVRPDRHGWRWWRMWGSGCIPAGSSIECQPDLGWRIKSNGMHTFDWNVPNSSDADRTVIPTDEQGNPVSWESIEQGRSAGQTAPMVTGRTATLIYVDDITTAPSAQELRTAWDSINKTLLPPTQPLPLPRFTTDELDDVDHSKTTKLDEVTLRRGKLPMVEQIAKYREVRAKRSGGTVADALKESRIDCEVTQYVLERWAGGLDSTAAHKLIAWVVETTDVGLGLFVCSAEARAQQWIDHHNPTLDTSEKPSPTVQRERQEAEERRQRLAELRQRLAAERAAQPAEEVPTTTSRFDLIEPDPQADPAASIRAWEARQAAAKVRPVAAPPRIAKHAATPRRLAIEVVDAEVDGLSRSEAFVALVGRAFNGGC